MPSRAVRGVRREAINESDIDENEKTPKKKTLKRRGGRQ